MFHEVGAVDSIVDVCSVAICLDDLGIEDIVVESLSEGHGTIRCAHGLMPIPVPAVVNLCQAGNIALTPAPVAGELVTPRAPPSSPRCARPSTCRHATTSRPSATAPASAPTRVAPARSVVYSLTWMHSHGCPQRKKPRCHRRGVLRAATRRGLRQDYRRRHHRSCPCWSATFYGLFKSKDDLLSELVNDICTHALDDDGTPLDDPLVQVEHILNNLWGTPSGRSSPRSRSRLARLRRLSPQDHHVTSSRNRPRRPHRPRRHHGPQLLTTPHSLKLRSHRPMVGLAQLPSRQSRRSQRLPLSHKTPLRLSKKLTPKHRPNPGRHASQSITRASMPPNSNKPLPSKFRYMLGCLYERNKDPAAGRMG